MKKKFFSRKKGFTLLELLITMSIIVILVAAILVGIDNSRKKSSRASALQTMKSILPYAAECFMKGKPITDPAGEAEGICSGYNVNFPKFSTKTGYEYTQTGTSSNQYDYKARNKKNNKETITCDAETNKCVAETEP